MSRKVLPFYVPLTYLIRQALALTTISKATKWRLSNRWIRSLPKLLRIAAGATHYGCFGYAVHPVFEITTSCNLRCIHCHARGGENYINELDMKSAMKAIENLTSVKEFRTLVFTGGEPLMRKDIFLLTKFAHELGFNIVYATNATLITREIAKTMSKTGVIGVAASLDSLNPLKHDYFRGVRGAWKRALKGIRHVIEEGMYLQINITVSKLNYDEILDLIKFSDKLGAHVILLYHFLPFGRGELFKDLALSFEQYTNLIEKVVEIQENVELVIVPISTPYYYAYLVEKAKIPTKIARYWVTGCIAARGMFYIKPNGDVWPCPFLPLYAGNIVKEEAVNIWKGKIFELLRNRNNLEEPCKSCSYREVCGGCRGRAYILTGNPFASDPTCPIKHIVNNV